MQSKYTPSQIILEILSAAVVLVGILFFLFSWQSIPEQIPTHYDVSGNPDAWNTKNMVIILFVIQVLAYISITLLSFFPKLWNRPGNLSESSQSVYHSVTRTLLLEMKMLIVLAFGYLTVCTAKAIRLNLFIMLFFIIVIIISVARYFICLMKISLADARRELKKECGNDETISL